MGACQPVLVSVRVLPVLYVWIHRRARIGGAGMMPAIERSHYLHDKSFSCCARFFSFFFFSSRFSSAIFIIIIFDSFLFFFSSLLSSSLLTSLPLLTTLSSTNLRHQVSVSRVSVPLLLLPTTASQPLSLGSQPETHTVHGSMARSAYFIYI